MFPQRLDSALAYDIAKAMMDGFNRHYRLFRTESARAKHRFETADWHGQQRAQRERIEFYDLRVRECTMRLEKEFKADAQPMDVWQQIKLHYIGLLVDLKVGGSTFDGVESLYIAAVAEVFNKKRS